MAEDLEDDSDSDIEDIVQPLAHSPPVVGLGATNAGAERALNQWRDTIAESMWNDFVNGIN